MQYLCPKSASYQIHTFKKIPTETISKVHLKSNMVCKRVKCNVSFLLVNVITKRFNLFYYNLYHTSYFQLISTYVAI